MKSTRTSTAEQERGLAEVTQLNNLLQLRLQNAEESDQVLIEQKIIYIVILLCPLLSFFSSNLGQL